MLIQDQANSALEISEESIEKVEQVMEKILRASDGDASKEEIDHKSYGT